MQKLVYYLLPLLLFFQLDFGWAQSSRQRSVVHQIKLQGHRKIEKDAVLARLKTKRGEKYLKTNVQEDVRNLFGTGYFYNVEVSKTVTREGVTLTYKLTEKPSIVELVFRGNTEIEDEEIQEASGLKTYEILNMSSVLEAIEKIQKLYEDKGFFLAQVHHKVTPIKKGESVRVEFDVEENDKVQVKEIRFLGNRHLGDSKLKSRMLTQEGGFFSFFSSSGAYKQEAFDRDVQVLKYLYFNEGYVQVRVDRPQVYVTPDKKGIFITIRIEEGEQFRVGEIDFTGDLLFENEELLETIGIDQSEIFVYETLQKDLSALQAKYGDLGYAFANIIPRTRIKEEDRIVDVTFEIDKGQKVYFGEINIIGNTKTRDKVIRRELKIHEGELYNETNKRRSMENVQRLGFFEEVNFKTNTPENRQNILNIDIVVKERNTGSIQIGAGYGTASGTQINAQVSQSNFLGYGQKLSVSYNSSRDSTQYNLNFTEPYFLDTQWSVGGDVFHNRSSRGDYFDRSTGGAVRFGHPLAEFLKGWVRLKNEYTDLDRNIEDDDLYPIATAEGVTNSITFTLQYDKRNDRFSPSKGAYSSLSLEYAGIGGDLRYTKGNTTFQYFKKLFWNVVLRNNLSFSFISAHDNCKNKISVNGEMVCKPPFNELYLLGGPYSLRGYRWTTVGKRVLSQVRKKELTDDGVAEGRANELANRPFGGEQQLIYTAEFEFPLIEEAGIKGVLFYDIGQAEDVITSENFFADVGFGFRWFSPIGPLRFEWGIPLNRNLTYHPEPVVFDFSIGSPF